MLSTFLKVARVLIPAAFLLAVAARADDPGPKEKLELIRAIPHSGYSEGIDFHDGFLWHTLPQEILKIDPKDGTILKRFPPASAYNESPTWFQGKLWILSYHDNGIRIGTLSGDTFSWERVGSTPEIHGWGITHDGKHIIITGDYSSKLYFLDPKTAQVARTLQTNVVDIEDLAWDGTGIWASSFTHYRGSIFRIDPKTGQANALFELPDPDQCPVIDGLAYDGKSLWVTGKHCPSIYNVKVPKVRLLSSKKPSP